MNPLIQPKKAIPLFLVVLTCFALSPAVRAVSPPPDGGYPGENTAEGQDALFSLTTGFDNTAIGFEALVSNTTGEDNTATGAAALHSNTTGILNTAIGFEALVSNTIGGFNTATGVAALHSNTTGNDNTATGVAALFLNTTGEANTATGAAALQENNGNSNTATGSFALGNNHSGNFNTATGFFALANNRSGNSNTVTGVEALFENTRGDKNTASGRKALHRNTTGSFNIALGAEAGANLTTGDNNIDIGNPGVRDESSTIRIGTVGAHTKTFIAGISDAAIGGMEVRVNQNGRLGTEPSSKRFKEGIKPMDKASEVLLALRPVTFRYKPEIDPEDVAQFGLVAEDVEKVNPDLVIRDQEGKPYSVRYDAVNAMLLNEFLKEHRKVEHMQKQIEALAAGLQKVSAQLEATRSAPQTVLNNH